MKIVFILIVACLISGCSYYEKEKLKEILNDYMSFYVDFYQTHGRIPRIDDDRRYLKEVGGCNKVTFYESGITKNTNNISLSYKELDCYSFTKKDTYSGKKRKRVIIRYKLELHSNLFIKKRSLSVHSGRVSCSVALKDQQGDIDFIEINKMIKCNKRQIQIFGQ